MEPDPCVNGPVCYVLEGRFEVRFEGEEISYSECGNILIPTGKDHEHTGRARAHEVRLVSWRSKE